MEYIKEFVIFFIIYKTYKRSIFMIGEVMHIGITVSNIEKSIHFYKDILGLTFKGEAVMEGKKTDL